MAPISAGLPHQKRTKGLVITAIVLALIAGVALGIRNIQRSFLEEVVVETPGESELGIPETSGRQSSLQTAPDFSLQDRKGAFVHLHDLRGEAVVLLFFSSWNEASLDGLRMLNAVSEKLKDAGIVVFAVDSLESTDAVAMLYSRMELQVPVLADSVGDVGEAYHIMTLPAFFFIGADGMLKEHVVGMLNAETLLIKALRLK